VEPLARPATAQGDRPVAVGREQDQGEDRYEVPDVEPRRRWVETDVGGDRLVRGESRLQPVRRSMELPAPAHLGNEPRRPGIERGRRPIGGRHRTGGRAVVSATRWGERALTDPMVSSPPHADSPPEASASPPQRCREARTWGW